MSVAPQPIIIQVVRTAPRSFDGYFVKGARVLGISQLVLAGFAILFNIASICLEIETSYSGYGITCAIFWLIAGAFGIASASRKSACTIITTMVMSVLSALTILTYQWTASMQMAEVLNESTEDNHDSKECGCFMVSGEDGSGMNATQEICVDCWLEPMPVHTSKVAITSMLLIIGIIELVVAIVASVFCCRTVCCCRKSQTAQIETSGQFVVVNGIHGQTIRMPPGYHVVAPAPGNEEKPAMPSTPGYSTSPPPPYTIDTKY